MILVLLFGVKGYVFAEEEVMKEMIECEEPNGEAGYYITKPKVYVHHMEKAAVTKILFMKPDGECVERILKMDEEVSLYIDEEWFQEGKHVLEVWQEDEEGKEIEETRKRKEFLVDTKQPEKVQYHYEKEEEGEVLCFSKSMAVELTVQDTGSGIKELCYQLEGGKVVRKEADSLSVEIPVHYAGKITAWAVDAAGNEGKTTVSKCIITENQKPEIRITSKENLEMWHNKDIVVNINVKESSILSGIQKVGCYVNGKLVEEKENPLPFIEEENFSITVKDTSEIIIEAEDYVGNKSNIGQKIFIDKEKPNISIEGIYDNMITGNPVNVYSAVEDNQQIQSAKLSIFLENENGEKILLDSGEWEKRGKFWEISNSLEEDGIYYIEVQAVDIAGNISTQKYRIVVDKTNPIIRYVEEMQGKYLQQFKWEYGLEDIIQDFTHYTYEIRLDGKLKNGRMLERSEGKHIFSVRAVDSAGNKAEARAEFIIDHTKPVILFKGVEKGEIYEQRAEAVIATEQESDQITDIFINGEKQIENQSGRIHKFTFEDAGKYELLVKAKDLAGNETSEKIEFEVKKKEGVLQKIFYNREQNNQNGKIRAKGNSNFVVLYMAAGMCSMMILCGGIIYKKNSHKREDAG